MDKKWGAPKVIGLIIGVPLCLYFFGLQFLFVAVIVGTVMVWESVSESERYHEHRRQRLLRRASSSASGDSDT